MSAKDSTVSVDLSGAVLTINGMDTHVEAGELTIRENYLYSADDAPNDPTQVVREISADVELSNPDGVEFTFNKELRALVEQWREDVRDMPRLSDRSKVRDCADELEELIGDE